MLRLQTALPELPSQYHLVVESASTEAFCLYGKTVAGSRYLGPLYQQCQTGVDTTYLSAAATPNNISHSAQTRQRRTDNVTQTGMVAIEFYMEEVVAGDVRLISQERVAAAFASAPESALTTLYGLGFRFVDVRPKAPLSTSTIGVATTITNVTTGPTTTIEVSSAAESSGITPDEVAIAVTAVILVCLLCTVALVLVFRVSSPTVDKHAQGAVPQSSYVHNHTGGSVDDIARLYSDHAANSASGWDQMTYAITDAAAGEKTARAGSPTMSASALYQARSNTPTAAMYQPREEPIGEAVEWENVQSTLTAAARHNTVRDVSSPAFSTTTVDQDIDDEWNVLINTMGHIGINGSARTNVTDSALGYISTMPIDGYFSTAPGNDGYLSTYPDVPNEVDQQLATLLNMRDMCDDSVDGADSSTMLERKAVIDRQLASLRHVVNPGYLSIGTGGGATPTGHFYPGGQDGGLSANDAASGYLHFPANSQVRFVRTMPCHTLVCAAVDTTPCQTMPCHARACVCTMVCIVVCLCHRSCVKCVASNRQHSYRPIPHTPPHTPPQYKYLRRCFLLVHEHVWNSVAIGN